MILGNTTNTTCQFSFKQYNLLYTVQKHEIYPFIETESRCKVYSSTPSFPDVCKHALWNVRNPTE